MVALFWKQLSAVCCSQELLQAEMATSTLPPVGETIRAVQDAHDATHEPDCEPDSAQKNARSEAWWALVPMWATLLKQLMGPAARQVLVELEPPAGWPSKPGHAVQSAAHWCPPAVQRNGLATIPWQVDASGRSQAPSLHLAASVLLSRRPTVCSGRSRVERRAQPPQGPCREAR